jgi:hypothetical protein
VRVREPSTGMPDQWLLRALAAAVIEPHFGRTPDMFGDAIRAENSATDDCWLALAVEPGEDIVSGVLAPDNDPGHGRLL